MAQFDLHRNQDTGTRDRIPYLLDVQADILGALATRVVIPVVPLADIGKPVKHLNPVIEVDGVTMMLMTSELAGVSVRNLGAKVASLEDRRYEIIAALDFLLTGI